MDVTTNTLIQKLLNHAGSSSFAQMVIRTVPNLRKTNNPFWDKETKTMNIYKVQNLNVHVGGKYQRVVQNRRIKAGLGGNFVPGPRAIDWVRRGQSCILDKKLVGGGTSTVAEVGVVRRDGTYYTRADGTLLNENEVATIRTLTPKTRAYEGQGLPEGQEWSLMTVKIENIVSLSLDGETIKQDLPF